jgi:hypothetical protein
MNKKGNYFTNTYQLEKYLVQYDRRLSNASVGKAKNATFQSWFMEYHKERFDDFSLLIFDDKKLVAVLCK